MGPLTRCASRARLQIGRGERLLQRALPCDRRACGRRRRTKLSALLGPPSARRRAHRTGPRRAVDSRKQKQIAEATRGRIGREPLVVVLIRIAAAKKAATAPERLGPRTICLGRLIAIVVFRLRPVLIARVAPEALHVGAPHLGARQVGPRSGIILIPSGVAVRLFARIAVRAVPAIAVGIIKTIVTPRVLPAR